MKSCEFIDNLFYLVIIIIKSIKSKFYYLNIFFKLFGSLIDEWGLGIGDWGLGIGDWGVGPKTQNPKPQTPKPNPKKKKKN